MQQFVDIHCHILPGVDDGAGNEEMTRSMLKMAWNDGIRIMVATPHYHPRKVKVSFSEIYKRFKKTREIAKSIDDGFEICLGMEVYTTVDSIRQIQEGLILPLNGSGYSLWEFDPLVSWEQMERMLSEIRMQGTHPVLAHVERYGCMLQEPDRVEELRERGIVIQMNASSVTGDNGRHVRKFAKELLKYEMVDVIGTDAHSDRRRSPVMSKCYTHIAKKYGREYAERVCCENARRLIKK